ncbi:hypothetical protein EVAR_86160_1 [Eumeta japonica]|uniref:Uncharacterized protein n=1 Tax=Eumeta variegata TaxID=151549 RepID=A0A4C1Z3P3_EUMVA|nr:hypothetical protein EVAR_86160_1 [Eumeta japonica]
MNRNVRRNRIQVRPARPTTGLILRWPILSLIQFTGRDLRTNLTADQKFGYLLSCLSAEPRGLVQHFNISNNSYPIARDLSERRYQNTRRLADSFISEILNPPNVEVADGLAQPSPDDYQVIWGTKTSG